MSLLSDEGDEHIMRGRVSPLVKPSTGHGSKVLPNGLKIASSLIGFELNPGK